MIYILAALLLWHPQQPIDSTMVPMSDQVRLFVKEIRNDKPICIFLHGGPGAWSRSFEDLHGEEFSSLFSMVFFDQRGGGRSDTAADYSLKRMVQDIEELRIHLHAEHIYLLAHSFGGVLAEQYAEIYPNHLEGLILLNCTLDIDNSLLNQIAYMNELSGRDNKAAASGAVKESTAEILSSLINAQDPCLPIRPPLPSARSLWLIQRIAR